MLAIATGNILVILDLVYSDHTRLQYSSSYRIYRGGITQAFLLQRNRIQVDRRYSYIYALLEIALFTKFIQ